MSLDSNGLDKEALWGTYMDSVRWQSRLGKKVAHKAVDIPEEDMIHVDNRKTGFGLKEILALGIAATGVGGVFQIPAILEAVKPVAESVAPVINNISPTTPGDGKGSWDWDTPE